MSDMNDQAHLISRPDEDTISLLDLLIPLAEHWKWLIAAPIAAGLTSLAVSTWIIPPTFTAKATILPPQQQQSSAAAALSQLGALSGLAGAAAGIKSPADQYVALLQSDRVSDRIIDRFGLMEVYEAKYRTHARKSLDANVSVAVGKKDGLMVIEAKDESPQRAADMANAYIEELRLLSRDIALTEAQQRRKFFEEQLERSKSRLSQAQGKLQASGFNAGALKVEPKAAAEAYARLRAEITAAEVRLQTMRGTLSDSSSAVQSQQNTLAALRGQLAKLERSQVDQPSGEGADYIARYREFKYEETLFDLFAKQYELARVDESREGALIQVIDPAAPPELKTGPKRGLIAVITTLATGMAWVLGIFLISAWRRTQSDPEGAVKVQALRKAFKGR